MNRKVAALLAAALVTVSDAVISSEASSPPAPSEPRCTWMDVATKWNVNPYMLYAIAKTESNLNPKAINRNTNGSEDVGMMQINSWWYPKLAKFGIERHHLFDPCVSLDVAGWILSQNMTQHGNTWTAVGAYNAVSPDKRVRYAKKILKNLPKEAFQQ